MRAASLLRSVGSVVVVGLVASVVLSGCRPGTALHSRYNDFRAYYNAYYNAERKLEEGEETLQARNQRIDRGRLIELFPTGLASGRGETFQETVDKSAELLRDRPSSKWADDALLLIGKAYFYQRNFVGAEQKFRETAEAAEVRGEPRLADEARFWLGRTYAVTERYDDGVAILQDALAQTEISPRWRAQILLALGELYGRAERWEDAAAAIREGLETVGDRELAARAYVLLGQVEEASGTWDAAAEAYAMAARRAPAYELEYAARLNEALVLGLDAGRSEEALERIRAMRRDDKNFQQRAEVELAWARIQAASGDLEGANRRFRDVLYEETLAGGQVRGEAHYRFAEFHRDFARDFVRASAHFDTAATALPNRPDASVRLSRSAIRDPQRVADTFTSIAETSQRIAEIDSLVALASLSEDAFAARIAEIEAERLRVFLEEQRRTNQLRANEAFRDTEGRGVGQQPSGEGSEPANAIAGFLGHRDPATVQAGQIAFEQAWGDRPLVPNWRRRAAVEASALAVSGETGEVQAQTQRPTGQGPPPLDLSAIPRTPAQQQELGVELAELRYELANALFLSLGRADSAVVLYRQILDETPDAPVAPRARYALAEVEYAEGRTEAATPLFQDVIEADPESELAQAARIRLGIEPVEEEPDERAEVEDPSIALFAEARRQWGEGDPLRAMMTFIALGEANPDAPMAPRAFLAGAAAYADFARGDSLLLIAALPDSLSPALFRDTLSTELAEQEAPSSTAEPEDSDGALGDEGALGETNDGLEADVDSDDELVPRRQVPRPVSAPDDEERIDADDEELLARSQSPRPVRVPDDEDLQPSEAPDVDDDIDTEGRIVVDDDMDPPFQGDVSDSPEERQLEADSLVTSELETPERVAPEGALPSDSLLAVPAAMDSRAGTVDSTAVLEGLVGQDSGMAVDSLAVESLVADSLAADSLQVPAAPAFTLADYLNALAERYPGTIEAEQAQALAEALPRAEKPAALEVPEPPADLDREEGHAAAPEPDEEVDSDEPPPEPVAPPVDLDANPYGTFGDQPLMPEVGGFTRRTNGLADAVEASELVRQLVDEGFRAAVATDGRDVFVVVGQYPSDKDLAIATAELPAATLGAGTGIVRFEDIDILPLVDGEDGR
ncbi:MAG: tetratricopeptide repeat protein [Bacteroidota bacterium]